MFIYLIMQNQEQVGYKVVDNKVIGSLELSHIYFGDLKDNNKELHKQYSIR